MKYFFQGFYQPFALELGLSCDDLAVLRWLVDYVGTNKMQTVTENGKVYYWVNYTAVLEDLPLLRISKQTLMRQRFGALCEAGVLERKTVREGGVFSFYAFGKNYSGLLFKAAE